MKSFNVLKRALDKYGYVYVNVEEAKLFNPYTCSHDWNEEGTEAKVTKLLWTDDSSYLDYQYTDRY